MFNSIINALINELIFLDAGYAV